MDSVFVAFYPYSMDPFYMIEGIGSNYGFLTNTWYDKFLLHVSIRLQCFTNSQGVYPKGISVCNFITSNEVYDPPQNWSVYPNPTEGRLEISVGHNFTSARVYSLDGKLVKEQVLQIQSRNTLSIEGEAGVYIIQLQSANGNIRTTKVIKR